MWRKGGALHEKEWIVTDPFFSSRHNVVPNDNYR